MKRIESFVSMSAMIFCIFLFCRHQAEAQLVKAVVAVTGSIKDDVTKSPLSAKIEVYDNTGKKVNSTKSNHADDGYYFVTGLVPGNTYFFSIQSGPHFKEYIPIVIPNTDKYLEISRDINLKPLEKGAKFPLPVPPFEFNKSKLRFGASTALESLTGTLKNNPEVYFTIMAYPDNNNDPSYNKELTAQRADALMDYFVVQGIDPARIKISGSESTDPKMPPPTEKRAKGKKYIGSTYIIIDKF